MHRGRGVGGDVVRRSIERLNGTIRVDSTPGKGTTFTMTLPVTLSITRALLVRHAGHTFAIPLFFSERILDPEIEAKGWEKIRSTVEVDLVDGRTLVEHADERYRGGPDLPFTRDELFEKWSDCASLVLPPSGVDEVFELVDGLERLDDVTTLVGALTTPATKH